MWRADSLEKAGGEGDDRGWDGWMASPTQWTWVRVNSRSWWWTGRPGVLQSMGWQRVGHDWETELNWANICSITYFLQILFTYAIEVFSDQNMEKCLTLNCCILVHGANTYQFHATVFGGSLKPFVTPALNHTATSILMCVLCFYAVAPTRRHGTITKVQLELNR